MSTVRRWPAACRILPLRRCGGCDFEALFSGSTYEENYRHALQQRQSVLSPCLLTGSMTGEKKRFTYIGKASMVERGDSNGDTKWQSLDFDSRWVGRRIFDFPVLIDEFADIESALTDPTSDVPIPP